jgi:hypothetical protein
MVGNNNTAVGSDALGFTTVSSGNTAVGFQAAFNFDLGADNTIIGAGADATANGIVNSVALGKDARVTANNQVRLGNALTTSIGGVVGFSNISDGRFKKNIQEKVKGLDFIMKLRPVTYQLDIAGIKGNLGISSENEGTGAKSNSGIDENQKTVFSGFVAQEVEKSARDADYDFSGIDKPKNDHDLYGLRYSEFVVPLVKAVQEQQQMIVELKKQNDDLQKRLLAVENK